MTDHEDMRIDVAMARRGLARSREHAARLVAAGRVTVGGRTARKPALRIGPDARLEVASDGGGPDYVSRGGDKFAGALAAFGPDRPWIQGRSCLDLGSSTGGFTDVLLRRGAARVACVDVGHGQLAPPLRDDPRTVVLEGTDARQLDCAQFAGPAELVVADLSFISLTHVLPVLDRLSVWTADVVLLVKPQFEVGRDRVGKRGVVHDPALRAEAVREVCGVAAGLGWGLQAVVPSPVPGSWGNVEYFVWLRRGSAVVADDAIDRAVAEAPDGEKVSS